MTLRILHMMMRGDERSFLYIVFINSMVVIIIVIWHMSIAHGVGQ